MRKWMLIAALAALPLSSSAFAAADTCIRQVDIRNWTSPNDKSIVLEDYRHRKVLLKLVGTCSDFKYNNALEIHSHGITRLDCVQVGDTIVTRSLGFNGRCAIASVAPYTGAVSNTHHDDHGHDHDGN